MYAGHTRSSAPKGGHSPGAIPSGIAYGVAAHGAGLGPGETQLMSLVVFSAAAQVGAVALLGAGRRSRC